MERYLPANYALTFAWGVAVLLGMIGLGRLVARAIRDDSAVAAGWGLHAAWGAALYVFLGGLLALFGLCTAAAITLLIGAGLAAFLWTTYRGGLPSRAALARMPWQNWPVFALVAFVFAGGLCWQNNVNPCDDLVAYYNFCEKLLATGSFGEPFSWRRLASLGGHTLLQCSVLSRASYVNAQAFEVALCPVILLGLILGFRGGVLGRTPLGMLLAAIAVTTPILRVNTASHFTGVVLLVALFVTLDLAERTPARRLALLGVAGMIAAALSSLRAQYVPAAGGAIGLFWLVSWLKDRAAMRIALSEAACWGGSFFLGLLPWMIMGFLSNGSPLFPLFQGGNNPGFIPPVDQPVFVRLGSPLRMILHPALLPLLLCTLAAPAWRRSVAARAVVISGVFASLLLAYSISLVPDDLTVPRYVQPLLVAAGLVALLGAAVSPRGRLVVWALSVLLLVVSLPQRSDDLWSHYTALATGSKWKVPLRGADIADHRKAQELVPEGKRVLVCSDYPFLFDHQRNPIWSIDLPSATSPAPGLPFHQPPEETKRYLRNLGIEYVIFVDCAHSANLYNRRNWQEHERGDVELWKKQAPYFLDFFATTEHLASSETILGRVGALTVLQFKP
jgi:hypothetical protein